MPRSLRKDSGVYEIRSSAATIRARKYGMPQVLYEMFGPFSRTVTFSRGSTRLERDAAVNPAAFPPMTRIFSILISQILLAHFDPRIGIALAGALDHEVMLVAFDEADALQPGVPDQPFDFGARERRAKNRFDVRPHR